VTARSPHLTEHLTGIPAKTRRPLSLIEYPLIGMTGFTACRRKRRARSARSVRLCWQPPSVGATAHSGGSGTSYRIQAHTFREDLLICIDLGAGTDP
jgi:hypothetical protein